VCVLSMCMCVDPYVGVCVCMCVCMDAVLSLCVVNEHMCVYVSPKGRVY